jgi:hypothetical protein
MGWGSHGGGDYEVKGPEQMRIVAGRLPGGSGIELGLGG